MLQQFVYISLTSLGSIACFSVWWNQSKFMQQSKVVVRLHSQNLHERVKEKILFSHQETFSFKPEIFYKETLKEVYITF